MPDETTQSIDARGVSALPQHDPVAGTHVFAVTRDGPVLDMPGGICGRCSSRSHCLGLAWNNQNRRCPLDHGEPAGQWSANSITDAGHERRLHRKQVALLGLADAIERPFIPIAVRKLGHSDRIIKREILHPGKPAFVPFGQRPVRAPCAHRHGDSLADRHDLPVPTVDDHIAGGHPAHIEMMRDLRRRGSGKDNAGSELQLV